MQRNRTEGHQEPRRNAERDARQPIAGPSPADDDDELQQPEDVPNFLTARELQARDPAKGHGEGTVEERHGSASFAGSEGEDWISDDEPPRGKRGQPDTRTDKLKKRPAGKSK